MTSGWTDGQLHDIEATKELAIATQRGDGTWRHWTPIWVVRVDQQVYVRTWYVRDNGWYGRAVAAGQARIRVPGVEADVTVENIGDVPPALRDEVDAAYRSKYGRWGARRMIAGDAAATTLRLTPSGRMS